MKKKRIIIICSLAIAFLIFGTYYYLDHQNDYDIKVSDIKNNKDKKEPKKLKEKNNEEKVDEEVLNNNEGNHEVKDNSLNNNESQTKISNSVQISNSNNEKASSNNSQSQSGQQNTSNTSTNIDNNSNQSNTSVPVQPSSSTQVQPQTNTPTQNYRVQYYTENGSVKTFSYDECKAFSIEYGFTDPVNIVGTSCVPVSSDLYKMEIRYLN